MAIKIRDAGTLRTIKKLTIQQAGVKRQIKTLKVMDGGALRLVASFAPPMSVNISPSIASGQGGGGPNETITTNTVTATPTGGQSPFTYVWTRATNGGGDPSTALASTSATTAFRKTNVPADDVVFDDWGVTVTDKFGTTAGASVNASFFNINPGLA